MTGGSNLSRKLLLEARERTPDNSGGTTEIWRTLGTIWADMAATTSREDFIAGQPRPRVKYRVIVRGAPVGAARRPTPDQRLREGERIFNILTVMEHTPDGKFLELIAEEGVLP